MNDVIYKVTSQSKANWRTHEHPTSQGDRYPIGEVKLGFGIEVLMAGSDMDGEALGEVSGDPMALLDVMFLALYDYLFLFFSFSFSIS